MNKSLILILTLCMINLNGLNVLAADNGEALASKKAQITEVTPRPDVTVMPESTVIPELTPSPDTAPAPEASSAPAAETSPMPASTLEPTASPAIARPFFYCMKNGSEYAYIKDGNKIIFEPMTANNGLTAAPKIFDDRSYLPFRYLFMSMLGFTEKNDNESLEEKQFTYYGSGENFTLEFKINNEVKVLTMTGLFNYDGDVMEELKLDNGVSYVPLRYFEENELCRLGWDDASKSIILANSDETRKTYFDMVKNNVLNDNYTTYSDIISAPDGNIVSVSDMIKSKAYSASNNFNLAVYSNESQKACYIELNKKQAPKPLSIFDTSYTRQDILIDRLVIHDDKIYGLKVSKENPYTGKLFSARLSAHIFDNKTGAYNIQAVDYKEILPSDGIILFNINTDSKNSYCYYVDSKDGYSLNRLNLENGENISVTAGGIPIKNADYFSIGSDRIVYNDFSEQKVKSGKFDGINVSSMTDVEKVSSIKFINYDKKNNRFFYVSVPETGSNTIKSIYTDKTGGLVTEDIFSAEKIRNLSIINGSVYAKVNDELKCCN